MRKKKGKKNENNDLFSNNIDKNLDNINKENDEEIDFLKLLQNIKLPDDKVKKISTSIKKNEDNLIISENIKIKDDNINIPFNNPSLSKNKCNIFLMIAILKAWICITVF